ncbi:Hypothetical_protein [Hexamita inflata]|uniref:Hypothetical_protein n=1 Tax=Hexamita inflata TaxID=28002 RepID=A0AA86NBW1_9EUKA|nr:Hypothetical protein HINF_LOCUS4497 [Hexamita inflata]
MSIHIYSNKNDYLVAELLSVADKTANIQIHNIDQSLEARSVPIEELIPLCSGKDALPKGTKVLAMWFDDQSAMYCINYYEAELVYDYNPGASFSVQLKFGQANKNQIVDVRTVALM